jgi:hypothetical protein
MQSVHPHLLHPSTMQKLFCEGKREPSYRHEGSGNEQPQPAGRR